MLVVIAFLNAHLLPKRTVMFNINIQWCIDKAFLVVKWQRMKQGPLKVFQSLLYDLTLKYNRLNITVANSTLTTKSTVRGG